MRAWRRRRWALRHSDGLGEAVVMVVRRAFVKVEWVAFGNGFLGRAWILGWLFARALLGVLGELPLLCGSTVAMA